MPNLDLPAVTDAADRAERNLEFCRQTKTGGTRDGEFFVGPLGGFVQGLDKARIFGHFGGSVAHFPICTVEHITLSKKKAPFRDGAEGLKII